MSLEGRPHDSGLATVWFFRIRICAGIQEKLYNIRVAGTGGSHQRRLAFRENGVRICASFQKRIDHRGAAVDAGQSERGHAIVIGRFDVRTCGKQSLRGFEIVLIHSPMKRGRAVGGFRIHVDFFLEERGHRLHIGFFDRVNQTNIDCGSSEEAAR